MIDAYWRLENVEDETSYVEIDMDDFQNLSGVETATRVLRTDVRATYNGQRSDVDPTLMAIEPGKFSQTAWFRSDLLPVHWWNYCSALVDYKAGVLASRGWEEKGVQLGDTISVKLSGNDSIDLTVLAFVDYWPGLDPTEQVEVNSSTSETAAKDFLVCNYNLRI